MSKDAGSRYASKKGRSPTDRFARLGHRLLLSPAYRALSPNARALLVELAMMENGRNNGTGLYLSVRDAADRIGVADPNTAGRAFQELEELGFISMTADSHLAIKAGAGSRARYWRLTWQAVAGKQGPTNDFYEAQPRPKTQAHKRMDRGLRALKRWTRQQSSGDPQKKFTVGNFPTLDTVCVGKSNTEGSPPWDVDEPSVCDLPTQKSYNGGKPPQSSDGKSHTYTAYQSGDADTDHSVASVAEAIRGQIANRWAGLTSSGRSSLASRCGLSNDEVRQYLEGSLELSIGKQMALRAAAKEAA